MTGTGLSLMGTPYVKPVDAPAPPFEHRPDGSLGLQETAEMLQSLTLALDIKNLFNGMLTWEPKEILESALSLTEEVLEDQVARQKEDESEELQNSPAPR